MKLRVVELLIISTIPAMVLAERGLPSLGTTIATLLGGTLAAGSANAFNQVIEKDIDKLKRIAKRERSPFYEVGVVTNDDKFTFESKSTGEKPMDFNLEDMFGSSPKTVINDISIQRNYSNLEYDHSHIKEYLLNTLSLEAVACKDWLTNKVDRCVTGKVAKQQC